MKFKCKICNQEFEDLDICPYCGSSGEDIVCLDDVIKGEEETPSNNEENESYRCLNCGRVSDNPVVCPYCGSNEMYSLKQNALFSYDLEENNELEDNVQEDLNVEDNNENNLSNIPESTLQDYTTEDKEEVSEDLNENSDYYDSFILLDILKNIYSYKLNNGKDNVFYYILKDIKSNILKEETTNEIVNIISDIEDLQEIQKSNKKLDNLLIALKALRDNND